MPQLYQKVRVIGGDLSVEGLSVLRLDKPQQILVVAFWSCPAPAATQRLIVGSGGGESGELHLLQLTDGHWKSDRLATLPFSVHDILPVGLQDQSAGWAILAAGRGANGFEVQLLTRQGAVHSALRADETRRAAGARNGRFAALDRERRRVVLKVMKRGWSEAVVAPPDVSHPPPLLLEDVEKRSRALAMFELDRLSALGVRLSGVGKLVRQHASFFAPND